jgi:hypothetical protein
LAPDVEDEDPVFRDAFGCGALENYIQQFWLNDEELDLSRSNMMSHLRHTIGWVRPREDTSRSYTTKEHHRIHNVIERSDGEAVTSLETSLTETCHEFANDA